MNLTDKIIELVPEIAVKCDCGWCRVHRASTKSGTLLRPITLADVLRAIDVSIKVNQLGGFSVWSEEKGWEDLAYPRWNLSTDLECQSDETKAFLAKILNV